MKKYWVILFVGATALLTACGGSDTDETTDEAVDTTADVEVRNTGDLKIAFYNQDSLQIYFKYYREQDSIMTQKGLDFQNEVQRRTNELQNYIIRNDERARQGLLSENEIIQIQQTVQQREAELMNYQQTKGGEIELETMQKLEKLGRMIHTFSEQYANENGIDILLIQAAGGQFGYIQPSMDVTVEFTEYLNQKQAEIENDDVQF